MKKTIFCLALATMLLLAAIPAYAESKFSTSYSGTCRRAFTPNANSVYLAKEANDNYWGGLNVNCTSCSYVNLDNYHDHVLKTYNASGGAAAENTYIFLNADNSYALYTSQHGTTKITFKVYNSKYYEDADDGYPMSVSATVTGYLHVD